MRALEFITRGVIYNPAYTYKFQLKPTMILYNLNINSTETCKQYLNVGLDVDQWLMEQVMTIFLNLEAEWYSSFSVQKEAIYKSNCLVNLILKELKTGYIPNTNRIQANIHISIAVKPSAFGEFVVILLKILIKTRNSVMSNAILPEDLKKKSLSVLLIIDLWSTLISVWLWNFKDGGS